MVEQNDDPVRERVLKLMDEKDRLESEIMEQNAVLQANNIGMQEPLVDDQGYPRGDIDVYKVRHARHRIICLQNDHKSLMKQIERGLAEVHSGSRATQQSAPVILPSPHIITNGHSNIIKEPFAYVTRVDDGSPADLAGLCENDMILQFGTLTQENFEDMAQLSNIVYHSVGQEINIEVKRNRSVVSLNLVPRPWAQPGLLGCHIQRI